jgi:hypothetical protein
MDLLIAVGDITIQCKENVRLVVRSVLISEGIQQAGAKTLLCDAFDIQSGMSPVLVEDDSIRSKSHLGFDWCFSIAWLADQVRGPVSQDR